MQGKKNHLYNPHSIEDSIYHPPCYYYVTTLAAATMSQQKIKVLFGAFPMNSYSEEEIKEFFDLFEQYGIKEIDTARGYVRPTTHPRVPALVMEGLDVITGFIDALSHRRTARSGWVSSRHPRNT